MSHLKFEECISKFFGIIHMVKNKQDQMLGKIFHHMEWNCWVWEQEIDIMMSHDCLIELNNFIKKLDDDLNIFTKEDEEKIKQRLKHLGYMD